MAGLLGFTLADLTQAVDARKRQYGNLAMGLLSDPGATLAQLSAQDMDRRRQDQSWVGASQSVMPEVRDAAQQRGMGAALNMGGLLGITKYQGGDVASKLNFRLREGLPAGDAQPAMDEVMQMMRPLERPHTLWRGVKSGPFAGAKVGDVISDPGFVSTSDSFGTASGFANKVTPDAAVLRIKAPPGTPHAYLPEESEYLLPPNLSYKVVDKIKKQDGTLVIGLEVQ